MTHTKRSFSAKLQTYVFILVTVLVAGLSGVFLNYLLYTVKDSFVGVTTGFAYYILRSHDIAKAIHDNTIPQIEKEISANMELQENILYVALIDANGKLVLDTTGGDVDKIYHGDKVNNWVLRSEKERFFYLRNVHLRNKSFDVANVILPVFSEGKVWGGGIVGVSANYLFRYALPRAAVFIAFLFFGFTSLSALVFFILIKVLLKPVRALIEGAEGIFDQNFETEVPVYGDDDLGKLAEIFNRLMSYLKDMISRLQGQSMLDPVTGCYREQFFRKQLTVELERTQRFRDPLCSGWIDLGVMFRNPQEASPAVGEQALKLFAEVLKKCTRHIDVLSRAEQAQRFGLIFPNTNLEGSEVVFNRLREAVAKNELRDEGGRLLATLSFSYGLVFIDPEQEAVAINAEGLLKRAETVLANARSQGPNRGEVVTIAPVI
jgi:diguanylate cyclase (GGDEF)-like protein